MCQEDSNRWERANEPDHFDHHKEVVFDGCHTSTLQRCYDNELKTGHAGVDPASRSGDQN